MIVVGLCVVFTIIGSLFGFHLSRLSLERKYTKRIELFETYSKKHLEIVKLYDRWVTVKQRGLSISGYLKENGINTVAIHGMSFVGQTLYDELKQSDVEIEYVIDRNANDMFWEIDIVTPDAMPKDVDLIIVTSNYYYKDIEKELRRYTKNQIISFEDLLYEI